MVKGCWNWEESRSQGIDDRLSVNSKEYIWYHARLAGEMHMRERGEDRRGGEKRGGKERAKERRRKGRQAKGKNIPGREVGTAILDCLIILTELISLNRNLSTLPKLDEDNPYHHPISCFSKCTKQPQ